MGRTATLSTERIERARSLYYNGGQSMAQIARMFRVSPGTIARAVEQTPVKEVAVLAATPITTLCPSCKAAPGFGCDVQYLNLTPEHFTKTPTGYFHTTRVERLQKG